MIKINKKNTENKCGAIINRLEHKKHQYCRGRTLSDPQNAITLISLVITIVVLVILSAVAIYLALGNNGILNKAKQAKNETIKQTATEKMNLKITNMQIEKYAEEQRMPTLQEFADGLCEDEEIQYVQLQSKKVGSLDKIEIGEASSIFTKLKAYPYEFEINSSLQLASIDGIKVATNNETVTINKEEYEQLKARISALEAKTNFTSPIFLTTANLPSTNSSTRTAGTYKASSSQYIKSDSENLSKYLTYTEGTGWTAKKSGFYYLNVSGGHNYGSSNGDINTYFLINNKKYLLTRQYVSSSHGNSKIAAQTAIYLNENDIIDFSFEPAPDGNYSWVWFSIFAMFE